MLCSNCTRYLFKCQSCIAKEGERNAASKSIVNRNTRRNNLAPRKKLLPNAQRHLQLQPNPNPIHSLQLPRLLRRSKRPLLAINANHRCKLQLLEERRKICNPRVGATRICPNTHSISNSRGWQIPPNKQQIYNPRTAAAESYCVVTAVGERALALCRRTHAPLSPSCALLRTRVGKPHTLHPETATSREFRRSSENSA